MSALSHAGKGVEDLRINLARIRLPGDGEHLVKADLLRHEPLQAPHLFMIAAKKLQKARLRARRAFDAASAKRDNPPLDFLQINCQIISPKARSLPRRRGLSRL